MAAIVDPLDRPALGLTRAITVLPGRLIMWALRSNVISMARARACSAVRCSTAQPDALVNREVLPCSARVPHATLLGTPYGAKIRSDSFQVLTTPFVLIAAECVFRTVQGGARSSTRRLPTAMGVLTASLLRLPASWRTSTPWCTTVEEVWTW
jgi:hypothetical protein